jgi:hypothetical protein
LKPNLIFIYILICLNCACSSQTVAPGTKTAGLVTDSVRQMTIHLTNDLAQNGPAAWLNYFDTGPDFFMSSDGQLVFKDYPAARVFIENKLVKSILKINLQFNSLRIDPLSAQLASMGADFHEDLTDSSGKVLSVDGYFTALAVSTVGGWKIRNLHWSLLHSK